MSLNEFFKTLFQNSFNVVDDKEPHYFKVHSIDLQTTWVSYREIMVSGKSGMLS